MELQNASVKKIGTSYGLLLGLLSILLSVIAYVMGVHIERPWWLSLLSFALMIFVILYGLKQFKKENGGFISLGESLKTGLAISLIAGIIGALFNYVFVTIIEPEFVNQMMDITREKMIEQNPNMTEEQMEMGLSISKKMMSPLIMSAFAIIASLFFGFIISLITGLIIKRDKPVEN